MYRMNKKLQRLTLGVTGSLSLFAVFSGLIFMGVLPSWKYAVRADESEAPALWNIKFKGMKITMEEKGKAHIHESGCLNIRLEDDYLIQIDVEDDTVDNKWNGIDGKMEGLKAAGYRIEQEPKRVTESGRDYVRYVVSMENERGSDYKRIYSEVCLMPADNERHFLVVIRYDGTDVDELNEDSKNELYNRAFAAAESILAAAEPTDEPDDEYGSYWMMNKNISPGHAYSASDSIMYDEGNLSLTYKLPEKCYLISDNDVAGKAYFDEENRIYIRVSVMNYVWQSAEEYVKKHYSSGFSRIHEQGQTEINGRVFYYYTYSVLERSKAEKKYQYYFHAFCDLDNGDIYTISGSAADNPLAMDKSYYLNVMDISEGE